MTNAPSLPRRFVCGFLFDSPVGNVALIEKNRPAAQKGYLNGLGGIIQQNETPRTAMSRKFLHEGGVLVPSEDWTCFHIERYAKSGDVVYFMTAKSSLFHLVATKTDERVVLTDATRVWDEHLDNSPRPMYNLCYLIPMAIVWLTRPEDRFFEN